MPQGDHANGILSLGCLLSPLITCLVTSSPNEVVLLMNDGIRRLLAVSKRGRPLSSEGHQLLRSKNAAFMALFSIVTILGLFTSNGHKRIIKQAATGRPGPNLIFCNKTEAYPLCGRQITEGRCTRLNLLHGLSINSSASDVMQL